MGISDDSTSDMESTSDADGWFDMHEDYSLLIYEDENRKMFVRKAYQMILIQICLIMVIIKYGMKYY